VNQHVKTVLVWVVILLALVVVIQFVKGPATRPKALNLTQLYDAVEAGRVRELTLTPDNVGYEIAGKEQEGDAEVPFTAYLVKDEQFIAKVREKGVTVNIERPR
jgi:ATP-dependent Zn protease